MKAIWAFLALLLWFTPAVASEDPDPLVTGVLSVAPKLGADVAAKHVHEARAAATEHGLEPELLLAMAYIESRFYPEATSRVEDGKRATGLWMSTKPAGTGPWFCGVMQTQARFDWNECLKQRDITLAYRHGASELKKWMSYVQGDLAKALRGYGCGWHGVKNGCNKYDSRVFVLKKRIASASRS